MHGFWTPLRHAPSFGVGTMLLLTDGTIMAQHSDAPDWWKLSPSHFGSYLDGTWSPRASGPTSPLYYASAVLRDGRVFVAGGEYNAGVSVDQNTAEIYDPLADAWTSLSTATLGWTHIGDAASCVLPDGRVLIGSIDDTRTAIYDPVANTWTNVALKDDRSSEETWTLLPDQTILVAECTNHPGAEKYVIAADSWVTAGSTPVDLVEASSIEIGPAVLLPDGRLFAVGATQHTALYTMPPIGNQPGSWASGPSIPPRAGTTLGAKDAPACLLPNGRVLFAAGPVNGVSGDYLPPTYFFEFDPGPDTLVPVPQPAGLNLTLAPYTGRMLLLPTGQVLFANGTTDVYVYTPTGFPDEAWRPHIVSHPTSVQRDHTYMLHGHQLNGLSQAVSYGDDCQAATNYPLVRLHDRHTGRVTYCRTFNHSTMGVATGTVVHSTEFHVPTGIPRRRHGYELSVVANGIASHPVPVSVT